MSAAQRTLPQTEAATLFRALVEQMNDGLFRADRDQRVVYVNNRLAEMLAYEPSELIGRFGPDFVVPSEREHAIRLFSQRAVGDETPYEITLERKDGAPLIVHMSPRPLFDEAGDFMGSVVVVTDLSDRIQTQKELERTGRALRVRVAQLSLLGEFSRRRATPEDSLRATFAWLVEALPAASQRPDIACVRLTLTDSVFESPRCRATAVALKAPVIIDDQTVGTLELGYLDDTDDAATLEDDRVLIEELAREIAQAIRQDGADGRLRTANQILKRSRAVLYRADAATLKMLFVSDNVDRLGYRPGDLIERPSLFAEAIHPDDAPRVHSRFRQAVDAGESTFTAEYRLRDSDGEIHWIEDSVMVLRDGDGATVVEGIAVDVTERKQVEHALAESERRFEHIFNGLDVCVWEVDFSRVLAELDRMRASGVADLEAHLAAIPETLAALRRLAWVVSVNDACLPLIGDDARACLPAAIPNLEAPGIDAVFPEILAAIWARQEFFRTELTLTATDGTEITGLVSMRVPHTVRSSRHVAMSVVDITERKRAEERVGYLARFDALTGLLNRNSFMERMELEQQRLKREGGGFAVLYLDLDHFKDINDTLGHSAGDELLRTVAERLRSSTRAMDAVARFGGDEFAVLQPGTASPADAAALAQKILDQLSTPATIRESEIAMGCSLGIVMSSPDEADTETLLTQADLALYEAKRRGRRTFRFHSEDMDKVVHDRMTLTQDLRRGIERDELLLHFQPQVAWPSGRITGCEALVRWNHPKEGLIPPGRFLDAAETMGMIGTLGRRILELACNQAAAWRQAGIAPDVVAVNISPIQLRREDAFLAAIEEVLESSGLAADLLELELTESVIADSSDQRQKLLERLGALGVRIAIDDFGTGASSMAHLRRYPARRVKIAQRFTRGMTTDHNSAAIVRATVRLAQELGLRVLAEGIETEEQITHYMALGCDQMQGFYFARPLPADEMTALLESRATLPLLDDDGDEEDEEDEEDDGIGIG